MRNSDSAYLFTYNYIWKLFSISIISAVPIPPSLAYQSGQTNKHTDKSLRFNYIDIHCSTHAFTPGNAKKNSHFGSILIDFQQTRTSKFRMTFRINLTCHTICIRGSYVILVILTSVSVQ